MFAADREDHKERESQSSFESRRVDARGLAQFLKEQRYRFVLHMASWYHKARRLTTDDRRSPHELAKKELWKDNPLSPCMQRWLYEAEAGPYNALHLQKGEYEGSATKATETRIIGETSEDTLGSIENREEFISSSLRHS